MLTAAGANVPMGKWIRISDAMFCGMRIGETDNLSDVEPFRLVAQAIADKVIPEGTPRSQSPAFASKGTTNS
jgi:hypothetical protein